MNRSRAPLWFGVILLVLGIFWIYRSFVSPMTPQTTFFPLTEFADSTHSVYTFTNLLLLAIFIVIEGWLVYTLFRFKSDEKKDELPPQTHGNSSLEVGFTVATVALVVILFIPSCQQIAFTQGEIPDEGNNLIVEVTGYQWWWEFYYPEYDLITANEIHLPAGRRVVFELNSADVIHSFWLPRQGGKRDMVPGRTQKIWFTPRPGDEGLYDGQCAEYCGTSHANMLFELVVDTEEDFDAWVKQQKAPNPDALAGFGLMATNGCVACHMTTANDKNVRGLQGPNLAKVATRGKIGAGMYDNNSEQMFHWIKQPQAMKPGSLMRVASAATMQCTDVGEPDACCIGEGVGNCMTDETVNEIVEYLQKLK